MRKPGGRKLISRLEDIPASFESEEDEVEFWETHTLSSELLESLSDAPELDEILGIGDSAKKRR